MATREEKPATPFVTPSVSMACVAVTAAGLLKAATSGDLSRFQLALVIALSGAYVLLLTAGLRFIEQRRTRAHLFAVLGIAVALGSAVVAVSRGEAFLLLMPLITCGVLFLSPAGLAAVVAACTAATVGTWAIRATSAGELVRDLATWIASLAFVFVVSRIVLSQHRARAEVESLAGELKDANDQLRAQARDIEELATTKERNRIARDIHDGLGHYLTVVHVQLEAAQATLDRDPDKARKALATAQQLTHEGLGEVRRSVAVLRGRAPAPRPILEAIEKLCHECTEDGIAAGMTVE